MAVRLNQIEIEKLLTERKPLPDDYRSRIQTKAKRGHKERDLDVKGANGSEFFLILRQSMFNPLDFSIILAYKVPKTNQLFRLRRYNGKSHEHTNILEKQKFYDFHIHMAIGHYQDESGFREDSYAEQTNRFADFHGAIECMLEDCGFEMPQSPQGKLFDEEQA